MQMAACMSYHPAQIVGIDKGDIQPGKAADVVIFDPEETYRIDKNTFASKGRNTPFDGKEVTGRVKCTMPEEYDPKQVIELLNAKKQHILCVRGNCDAEVDQMVLQFPIMADYCAIADGDTLIYATHGHTYNEQNLPPLHRGDISCLDGHTHRKMLCLKLKPLL